MVRHIVALICALFCVARSLKVREPGQVSQLHDRSPRHEPEEDAYHSDTTLSGHVNASISKRYLVDANVSHSDATHRAELGGPIDSNISARYLADTMHVGTDQEAGQYCGCNSSSCSVDSGKLEHDLTNELILIFGCSLDINAIEYFCNAVGSTVQNFQTKNAFSYLAHCNVGKFTIAYIFTPGASPAPYFSEYAGTATTQAVVKNSVHDVMLQFGREPSVVIVDASLWDVSNWWQMHGRPADPYPIPHAEIVRWCTRDVPDLLAWVQTNYPRSSVAFRTPPTVFADNGYGQNPGNIDTMVQCITEQKDPLNRLYGKYGFIDYHDFVDQALQHAVGPPMQTYYKDSLHPGPTLSMIYMNKVLNLARGLQR